jgi:hypothetical protein
MLSFLPMSPNASNNMQACNYFNDSHNPPNVWVMLFYFFTFVFHYPSQDKQTDSSPVIAVKSISLITSRSILLLTLSAFAILSERQ